MAEKLIITTDCGSKDIQAIEYANKNNIDIIVTDHHQILSQFYLDEH